MNNMNTFLLLEQSYMDDTTKKFLSRHFSLNYNLKYFNSVNGYYIPGSVGFLTGFFTEKELQLTIKEIVNDLQKYNPFVKFLGCNYKGYWISINQLKYIMDQKCDQLVKIKLLLNYQHSIIAIN